MLFSARFEFLGKEIKVIGPRETRLKNATESFYTALS